MASRKAKSSDAGDRADLAIAEVDASVTRLVELLKADDPGLLLKVLGKLGEFGAAPAISMLIRRFEEARDDALLRVRIVHALCAVGAVPDGRMAALKALTRAHDLEIEPVVLAAIRSAYDTLGLTIEEVALLAIERVYSAGSAKLESEPIRPG